mmetsp:Transcript_11070/g.27934  ORF Transcript_11070/g.27934 Transcript_11070/m.27934 type:complete len:201 (+) Transcript_11070:2-604(+)
MATGVGHFVFVRFYFYRTMTEYAYICCGLDRRLLCKREHAQAAHCALDAPLSRSLGAGGSGTGQPLQRERVVVVVVGGCCLHGRCGGELVDAGHHLLLQLGQDLQVGGFADGALDGLALACPLVQFHLEVLQLLLLAEPLLHGLEHLEAVAQRRDADVLAQARVVQRQQHLAVHVVGCEVGGVLCKPNATQPLHHFCGCE